MTTITQLYPLPSQEHPLEGLYLAHNIREQATRSKRAFVYTNFITSLDGRIAIPHPTKPGFTVPKNTANDRDWRLFQELAAQADLIISSGRYLRDWADGRAQEILQTDDPRHADLRAWRVEQGLPPQPDIAIVSRSLDFPIPEVLRADGRTVVVFTTQNPEPARIQEIEAQAGEVFVVGAESVDGVQLVSQMTALGYRTVYSAAGPRILHLLSAAGQLDRLYLTYANRLLGGQPFSSIVEGPLLADAIDMQIDQIYLDAEALDGVGQLFVAYKVQRL